MTNFGRNHISKLAGYAAMTALIITSCGSSGANDDVSASETTAAQTTEADAAETTDTDAAETTEAPESAETTIDDAPPETVEGQVVVGNLTLTPPEGWTSVQSGEDLLAALEEENPALLAIIEENGTSAQLAAASQNTDWIGVSPIGGSVNVVTAPPAEASTPLADVATDFKAAIESRGFTVSSEEDYTGPIGSGIRITIDTIGATGVAGGAETRIIQTDNDLIVFTSDALDPTSAESQLDLVIDTAQISG